jgi:hypothetical protein
MEGYITRLNLSKLELLQRAIPSLALLHSLYPVLPGSLGMLFEEWASAKAGPGWNAIYLDFNDKLGIDHLVVTKGWADFELDAEVLASDRFNVFGKSTSNLVFYNFGFFVLDLDFIRVIVLSGWSAVDEDRDYQSREKCELRHLEIVCG